jgi:hypothetical protein
MSDQSETVFCGETSTGMPQRLTTAHQNGVSRNQENELYDRLNPAISKSGSSSRPRPSTSSQSALITNQETKVNKLLYCLQRALPLASTIMALVALIMSALVISGAVTTTQSKTQILYVQGPGMQ